MANLTPQLQDACAELDKAHRRIAELEAGHRLLQERLQQSETLWQSLMQHSPMGMLLCQLHQDGRLLVAEASRAASRLLGKDVSQLQGQPLEAALPGLQSAEFLEQLKAQASGGPSAPSGPFTCAAPHTTLTIRAFRPIPRHVAVLLHEQSESEERLRQAEQATLASETEMESVFRVAPVGIGIVDNRRFSKVNDRVCEMLGYTREEILAQPNSKFLFLSDEEFETFGEQRARQIQEHGVSSVEILSRRKNGEIFELLLSSTELVVDGKPPRVTFTALDITQRKEAEKALRKSEERYRKLVEQSPTLILTHQQGRITFVNRAGMAMLGISSPEEVLGHPTLNFIRPSRQAATREHLRAAGETKAPTAECDLMRADGSVLHVHGNSSSYEMEGQSSGLFIGIDVTEKVKAEDALAEIREEYRKIFNNSILGVFQSLPCGRFQLLNPAMARIFGYGSPEDMLADITDIPTQLYVDGEERKSFLGAINERGQVETVERHMKRKNGQEICVYINARAVNYDPESGRYDYIDGFMEDITQRKLAEEALQRAEKEKALILSSIPDVVFFMAPDHTVTWVNQACTKLLGLSPENVVGRGYCKVLGSPEKCEKNCPGALAIERDAMVQKDLPRPDGSVWKVRAYPAHDDQGRVIGSVNVISDMTDQLRAQSALAEAEEKYRGVFNNTIIGIIRSTRDGRLKLVNPAMAELFGYDSPEDMMAHITSIPDQLCAAGQRKPSYMDWLDQHGEVKDFEGRMFRKNGEILNVRLFSKVADYDGPGGNWSLIDSHVEDISAKKTAEEALRRSEREKALILGSIKDMVLFVDNNQRIVWANEATAQGLGQAHKDMVGRICCEVMGEVLTPDECPVHATLKAGAKAETEVTCPDGAIWLVTSFPALDDNGTVTGAVKIVQDVTERRRAETAILESKEKYRVLFESTPIGTLVTNQQGRIMEANPSAQRLLGAEDANLLGKECPGRELPFINMDGSPMRSADFPGAKALKGNAIVANVDAGLLNLDGSTTWLKLTAAPIPLRGYGVAVSMTDITEQVQASEEAKAKEAQLMQADKMISLGTLAAGIAHEINNPNSLIMLNAPFVEEAWHGVAPILEEYYEQHGDFYVGGAPYSKMRGHVPRLLEGILSGSRKIRNIVRNMKNFSRPEEADFKETVVLNDVVRAAIELLFNTLKKTTRQFSVVYGENLPVTLGSVQGLEQIVVNLLLNAAEALSDPDRAIAVRTSYLPGEKLLLLEVADQGRGIRQEELTKVFEPFFTTKGRKGGIGLGMSISSKIAKAHGGSIKYESEPGKGTTARLYLPVSTVSR